MLNVTRKCDAGFHVGDKTWGGGGGPGAETVRRTSCELERTLAVVHGAEAARTGSGARERTAAMRSIFRRGIDSVRSAPTRSFTVAAFPK